MSLQQIFDGQEHELEALIRSARARVRGAADNAALAIVRERNAAIREKLETQERVLAFNAGEKVEPIRHEGGAIIVGKIS